MRRLTISPLAAVVLALAVAEPAAATFPGRPGQIAFARSGTGSFPSNGDIWVADRDGGNQRRLTHSRKADDFSPAYSPDGRKILYVRRHRGDADIWIMNANGSGPRPVTDSQLDDFQPTFYPSGRSILFTRYDGERGWTIYSRRLRAPYNQRIVQSNATFPTVSANGRWLAYTRVQDGVGGIRLENRRTGRVRRLTTGSAQDLDFSPSGRRIVFTGQRRCAGGDSRLRFSLLTIGINDRRARTIKRSCRREFINGAWSPNGRRLLFSHKKLASRGAALRFRLGLMLPGGRQVGGAPNHRRGTNELDPAWRPRPR